MVPRLVSLAAPTRLPPETIPAWTDPHWDGQIADLVLAAFLLNAALWSLVVCLRPGIARTGPIARGGWAVLGATVLYLSWVEFSDLHMLGLDRLQLKVLGARLFESSQARGSLAEFYLLIPAFVLGMSLFLWKGVREPSVRFLLAAGFLAWFLAAVLDETYPQLFQGAATELAWLCEETLEFSGSLLVGWGAVLALSPGIRGCGSRSCRFLAEALGCVLDSPSPWSALWLSRSFFDRRLPTLESRLPHAPGPLTWSSPTAVRYYRNSACFRRHSVGSTYECQAAIHRGVGMQSGALRESAAPARINSWFKVEQRCLPALFRRRSQSDFRRSPKRPCDHNLSS